MNFAYCFIKPKATFLGAENRLLFGWSYLGIRIRVSRFFLDLSICHTEGKNWHLVVDQRHATSICRFTCHFSCDFTRLFPIHAWIKEWLAPLKVKWKADEMRAQISILRSVTSSRIPWKFGIRSIELFLIKIFFLRPLCFVGLVSCFSILLHTKRDRKISSCWVYPQRWIDEKRRKK